MKFCIAVTVASVFVVCVQEKVQQTGGLSDAEESLLEGHLGVARELVSLLSPANKHHIGSDSGNTVHGNLVKVSCA